MSDIINYNYAANYAALDDIQSTTNDADEIRDEVNKVFAALSDVYTGEAAAALRQRENEISQAMAAVLTEITQTRSSGNQSQEDAAALDRSLAGGF